MLLKIFSTVPDTYQYEVNGVFLAFCKSIMS